MVLAVLVLALGGFVAWDRALLAGPGSPAALDLREEGEAFVVLKDGRAAALAPVGGAGVTRFWVALATRHSSRKSLLVVTGMLGEEAFRCLRIWALWGKLPARIPGVAAGQLPG